MDWTNGYDPTVMQETEHEHKCEWCEDPFTDGELIEGYKFCRKCSLASYQTFFQTVIKLEDTDIINLEKKQL